MKVVLFCGGLGTRLRAHTDEVPKPLVNIGPRPILWHLMRYYAHFGHTEFILCLGHMGDQVKQYFRDYAAELPNDLAVTEDASEIRLLDNSTIDWKVTFADTGLEASIGQRLRAVRHHLQGEEMFLANYSDGLSNLPLNEYLDRVRLEDKIASCVRVRPDRSFHTLNVGDDDIVSSIAAAADSNIWVNGGFFALKQEIFDYLGENEDLVEEPFQRLIAERQLLAYPHEDFWACMDTYKDKKAFDAMESRGDMPWRLWEH
ncbi:glucose-1-phosphate cytidylyltransferase [Halieaceae bacterium IMCC14734]|uniref:Glucose-1-phosphate cytidylyltransferase n=1 Tax=Candidatus Litorirhabdus singularis TaxID=2518993 RepID=A0ABT3TF76_9GAMM|nr:sugar phosphate nucleotidyltransferase [Candidatus Litorirhabdus singularis]MCX2980946.1 glucose-1-phosphate cytidylyltransferase [Candidatus Litorirhabdus singularis]